MNLGPLCLRLSSSKFRCWLLRFCFQVQPGFCKYYHSLWERGWSVYSQWASRSHEPVKKKKSSRELKCTCQDFVFLTEDIITRRGEKEQQPNIMFLKRKDIFVPKDELVRNWGDGSVGKVHASQVGGPEFRASESAWKLRQQRESVILVLETRALQGLAG